MRPQNTEELAAMIADAAASKRKLELRGGGSKAEVGAPREAEIVEMTAFTGVIDYDPSELVITLGAGTPLEEVEALVLEERHSFRTAADSSHFITDALQRPLQILAHRAVVFG